MKMEILNFLISLQEKGCGFYINVPNQWGAHDYPASPDDLIELNRDPVAYYVKMHGVSKIQYIQWVEESFSVHCAGKTSKGKRCKNVVTNGSNVDAKIWVQMQGEYCFLHNEGL